MTLRAFRVDDAVARGIPWIPGDPATMAGLTAVDGDGNIMGFAGGTRIGQRIWIFFNLFDERLRRPVFLHRLVKSGLKEFQVNNRCDLVVFLDEDKPHARRWLEVLGFVRAKPDDHDRWTRVIENHTGKEMWLWRDLKSSV